MTKLWIKAETKLAILAVIETSQQQGVSARRSCSILMVGHRRVVRGHQRTRPGQGLDDPVPGPKEPLHRILPEEVARIVAMAKSQEYVRHLNLVLCESWPCGKPKQVRVCQVNVTVRGFIFSRSGRYL